MSARLMLKKELENLMLNPEQVKQICELFDKINHQEEEERKLKQMEGIKKAKEEGRRLGRPKLPEPEDFNTIVKAWEDKEITASMGAKLCGMGVSTFYRRVNSFKDIENDGN